MIFDKNGYVHISDFGISKRVNLASKITDPSGTPGYMAPEVLLKRAQGYTVDYFSLGVVVYEMVFGRRPYKGHNKRELLDRLLYRQVKLQPEDLPKGFSLPVLDFINRLLERKPKSRLGSKSINEIMTHEWLKDVDWNGIRERTTKMPHFTPKEEENFDLSEVRKQDDFSYTRYNDCIEEINRKKCFRFFYFNYQDEIAHTHNVKGKRKSACTEGFLSQMSTKYFSPSQQSEFMKSINSYETEKSEY